MQQVAEQPPEDERAKARRVFLKKCGRFAAITGPAVALMLVSTTKAEATCASSTCPN